MLNKDNGCYETEPEYPSGDYGHVGRLAAPFLQSVSLSAAAKTNAISFSGESADGKRIGRRKCR